MKTLTVFLLVCAMMALTKAAAPPEAEAGNDEKEHRVVKRSTYYAAWTKFNGRYFYYVQKGMTWVQAEKNCQSMGANLASIHNTQEYHKIQALILSRTHEQKETWVGGSDAQQDKYWLWTDGSVFQYTNWCLGEPTDTLNQHCLQINYGGDKCWDDVQCYRRLPSVCAKKRQKRDT